MIKNRILDEVWNFDQIQGHIGTILSAYTSENLSFPVGGITVENRKRVDSQVNTVLARSHGKFQFEINPT